MDSLPILLFGLALHMLAGWLWIRHVRAERHHRASMPVIGSDPKLTDSKAILLKPSHTPAGIRIPIPLLFSQLFIQHLIDLR